MRPIPSPTSASADRSHAVRAGAAHDRRDRLRAHDVHGGRLRAAAAGTRWQMRSRAFHDTLAALSATSLMRRCTRASATSSSCKGRSRMR